MKRITILAAAAMMVFCTLDAAAQFAVQTDSTRTSNAKIHQSNIGISGYDMNGFKPGIEWPRGSGHTFMFASGLWLGAVIDNGSGLDSLTFICYNPSSGASWSTPDSELKYEVSYGVEQFSAVFSDKDLARYEGSPSQMAMQGYPLGVTIDQSVRTGGDGMLKDVAAITTVVTNTNQERDLQRVVLGFAIDADLGSTSTPASNLGNDRMQVLNGARVPIIQVYDTSDPEIGVIGIAMVEAPGGNGITTCVTTTIATDPIQANERYAVLTSGTINANADPADIRLMIGHDPVDLAPGTQATVTLLYMFAGSMSEETDQHMIDVVDGWGVQSSVDEEESGTALKVYPNPARTSDVIHVESSALITRTELVNVLGEVVAMSSTEPGMISAGSVPQGWYLIRAYTKTDVISQAIVIAN